MLSRPSASIESLPWEVVLIIGNYLDANSAFNLIVLCLATKFIKKFDSASVKNFYSKQKTFFSNLHSRNQERLRKEIKILCHSHSSFYYHPDEGLYAWGDNTEQELGIANEKPDFLQQAKNLVTNFTKAMEVYSSIGFAAAKEKAKHGVKKVYETKPKLVEFFKGQKILNIISVEDYSLALIDNGQVYIWGKNSPGMFGIRNVEKTSTPLLIESLSHEKIIAIAAEQKHALLLTNEGLVYGCGLEHGKGINIPQLIMSLADKKIVAIAVLSQGALFLTDEGKLYVWGNNLLGMLGMGDENFYAKPALNEALSDKKIIKITSFLYTAIVQTEENELYVFGMNTADIAGLASGFYHTPQRIPSFTDKKIVDIAMGTHILFLTEDGEVYGCGNNYQGQLCRKDNRILKPEKITALAGHKIIKIAAGSHSSFFLTSDLKLLSAGSNESGELGIGNFENQSLPRLVSFPKSKPVQKEDVVLARVRRG